MSRAVPHDVVASAPGKLVVVGEYAVLRGAPAVVAAVDVRARATRTGTRFGVALDDGGLLQACLDTLMTTGRAPCRGQYDVDTAAFSAAGRKLGLGSSSAACVAFLAAATCERPAQLDHDALHALAHRAHLRFSGGKGSGIDVAAAVHGGLLRFERGSDDDVPRVAPAAPLPADLSVLVVWTGLSQDTRTFVARVQQRASDAAPALDDIAAASVAFQQACAHADARDVVAVVDAAGAAMQELGERVGIDVVSAPHRTLRAIAREVRGAAKPSGAGGGDVGLLFVPTPHVDDAAERVRRAGLEIVPLQLGVGGVRVASA